MYSCVEALYFMIGNVTFGKGLIESMIYSRSDDGMLKKYLSKSFRWGYQGFHSFSPLSSLSSWVCVTVALLLNDALQQRPHYNAHATVPSWHLTCSIPKNLPTARHGTERAQCIDAAGNGAGGSEKKLPQTKLGQGIQLSC
jgi:hypothetical protein